MDGGHAGAGAAPPLGLNPESRRDRGAPRSPTRSLSVPPESTRALTTRPADAQVRFEPSYAATWTLQRCPR